MHPHLKNITTLLSDFDEKWAFCGGWAIDLTLNRVTREHKDVDIMLFREQQLVVQNYLSKRGWNLEYAQRRQLFKWNDGEFLELPIHTIWCKNDSYTPDFLEILLNEKDANHFVFRRDARIQRDLGKTFVETLSGLIALAPEIVLLYKSNNLAHADNQHDFTVGLEILTKGQKVWLKNALRTLYGEHEWMEKL